MKLPSMDRSTWTARFTAEGLALAPMLAGDDVAEEADDLIVDDPAVLQREPEDVAREIYAH